MGDKKKRPLFFLEPKGQSKKFKEACECSTRTDGKAPCDICDLKCKQQVSVDSWGDEDVKVKRTVRGTGNKVDYSCFGPLTTYVAEDLAVKGQIRDMFIYILFVIITTIIGISMMSISAYLFARAVRDIFVKSPYESFSLLPINEPIMNLTERSPSRGRRDYPLLYRLNRQGDGVEDYNIPKRRILEKDEFWGSNFLTTRTHGQLWKFIVDVLPILLFHDVWNPEWMKQLPDRSPLDDRIILYSSKLLGLPRIMQVRVRNSSCVIHPDVSDLFDHCYGYYSSSTEEKDDIIPTRLAKISEAGWQYRSGENLNMTSISGKISTYGPGGYIFEFGESSRVAMYQLRDLRDNFWISIATRAVIIDFTLYNPSVNLYLVCKLLAEMPPTGNVFTSAKFYPYKFLRYVSTLDYVALGCEIAFCVFIIYFIIVFAFDIVHYKGRIFRRFWPYVDLLIISLGLVCIGLAVYRFIVVEPHVLELTHREDRHAPFDHFSNVQYIFDTLCAILLFIIWLKLLKYLAITETIHLMNRTLARCARGILGFTFIFLVVFFAFAQLGYLVFGPEVENYSTVFVSCATLAATILGEFHYEEIALANRIVAPMFLILFIFFVFFVLLNMFLAIIAESYSYVKSEMIPTRDQTVSSYFGRLFQRIKGTAPDAVLTVRRVIDALKRANFKDYEIDAFFAKYRIRSTGNITQREAKRIVEDLHIRRLDFYGNQYNATTAKEVYDYVQRLDAKVDALDRKLSNK